MPNQYGLRWHETSFQSFVQEAWSGGGRHPHRYVHLAAQSEPEVEILTQKFGRERCGPAEIDYGRLFQMVIFNLWCRPILPFVVKAVKKVASWDLSPPTGRGFTASRKTGNFRIPMHNRHSSPFTERGFLLVLINSAGGHNFPWKAKTSPLYSADGQFCKTCLILIGNQQNTSASLLANTLQDGYYVDPKFRFDMSSI